jgi:hypothetical protein
MRKLLVLTGVTTVALVLLSPAEAARLHAAPLPIVKATVIGHPQPGVPGAITFTPKAVKQGVVIFKITNTDNDWHLFEIGGVTSRLMGPNRGKAIITVTFKKAGLYFASCPDDKDVNFAGVLKVT